MPLKKLPFSPGINREHTRYTTEGGWYECDKIRFRHEMPEKIGGWVQASAYTFLGVCRSLHSWINVLGSQFRGVGTHLKYYIEEGGTYYDVTPLKETTAAGAVTFAATNGSAIVTVNDTGSDTTVGSFVTFSGAVSLGGNITAGILNAEHVVTEVVTVDQYKITVSATANASDSGNGGAAVVGAYQIDVGEEITVPSSGWGSGPWGAGPWGTGTGDYTYMRRWNHTNFGEDLIFGPEYGKIYYWDWSGGLSARGVLLSSMGGASDVPTTHLHLMVSDISRFVFAFGCNELGQTELDRLLIRWSDQENAQNWTPSATNQAGGFKLSRGSTIVARQQARQEILVWTDTTLYSLQYVGAPIVWSAQAVGENISIVNDRAVVYSSGVAYWMGNGSFYAYDGHVMPITCEVKKYIFSNMNMEQNAQIFSGSNESFHEIWWFYCSSASTTVDRYVVYNYKDNIWYTGTMARTAWLDNAWSGLPLAAGYNHKLMVHEVGVDDGDSGTLTPINAYIQSSQFDIEDGHHFGFVWRIIPDISFEGSTTNDPQVDITLSTLHASGSGYNAPPSVGGVNIATVTRSVTVPVEQYTEQLYIRVRGRQMAFRVESNDLGVQWQLGHPRIDLRADGRR